MEEPMSHLRRIGDSSAKSNATLNVVRAATDPSGPKLDALSRKLRVDALLDTLVAVRMDLSRALGEGVSAHPARAAKLREIRALLDGAIVSTKDLIGEIDGSRG